MNVRNLLILSMLVTATGLCRAQGYYDDDIYFDSSKDKDKNIELAKKQAKTKPASAANGYILYPIADYPAADIYTPDGTLAMSVDEYNRRGIFANDTVSKDSAMSASGFEYTRQIERFYNPAIVKGSGDTELSQMYYVQPANVNIYINTPGYGYWGYPYNSWGYRYDPWFYGPGYWHSYNYWGSPWYWNSPWYWGSPAWGPSWAWGPAYWGPGWGWGASWGWGGGFSRPVSPRHPGALHSRRPGSNIGNTRPGNNVYRPGYNSGRHDRNNSGYRPAYNNGSSNYRPNYNQSNTNNTNNSNNTYTRPGRHNNSSYDNRNSSGSSYRSNSGGSYRSSGGSMGGRSTGGRGRGRH